MNAWTNEKNKNYYLRKLFPVINQKLAQKNNNNCNN